jgi:oligoribonuclease NrnB/cAMP/cGMP phosphodiesterase (DHH superfamily)
MKPLVIYHKNCADGFGAAFAAWLKLGDEAEYIPFQYNQELPNIYDVEDREIYILDFSFPRATMDTLFKIAKRVVWLDHHKTAFEMWCGGIPASGFYRYEALATPDPDQHWVTLDNNKSGAMIAWEYFHPDKKVPMLIRHIDDYDRWQFKLEGTKEFSKALWSYTPWSFEQWCLFLTTLPEPYSLSDSDKWHEAEEAILDRYYNEGAAILRAHDRNVTAVVKGAGRSCCIFKDAYNTYDAINARYNNTELLGLAANCPPHLSSDVGHQLATQSGTYGLLWYINKEGKCLCSLRSNGDYDVSTIAKAFGGGGHKNAAGFEISIATLLEWIK